MLDKMIEKETSFGTDNHENTPALNIEEILYEQPWKKNITLSKEQVSDVIEGINFLDLVIEGGRSVSQTMTDGVIIGDAEGVDAFDVAQKALSPFLDRHHSLSFDKVIRISKRVLQALTLMSGRRNLRNRIAENDLEVTRQVFALLSKEPQNEGRF